MKRSLFRPLLQAGTFFRKELLDVVRQPRLLITLVLGPFAIMAIFGLGYRDTAKPMRTVFVGPEGSPLLDDVERYADDIGAYVDFRGVSHDAADAERRLADGDIDLVVQFPDDPLGSVLAGEPATITVVHTRLDPVEQTAINFATRLAVDQINGEVLSRVVGSGQGAIRPAKEAFAAADASLDGLAAALDDGDGDATAAALEEVRSSTDELMLSVRLAAVLSERLAESSAGEALDDVGVDLADTAEELQTAVDDLGQQSTADQVDRVRQLISTVNDGFDQFTTVDPAVLVSPLRSEVRLAVENVEGVTDWYAPAAVVLVLQQFGVAFGALSFVRERQLGIAEVLRVAPVGPTVTLVGKYLAYLLLGGLIGALLTQLVVGVLGVPLASSWLDVGIVMGLTLFASIGVGFLISLASANDAQAVQYTMILLLASLFLSGFFLSVDQLQGVAEWASWLLPVTYGMQMLRDVMLRGTSPDPALMAGLAAYGVAAFAVVLLGARRRMAAVT